MRKETKQTAMLVALPIFMLLMSIGKPAESKEVPVGTARRVAEHVLGKTTLIDRTMELPESARSTMYLFTGSDGIGFVLVSADDCAIPVIGYSETSRYRSGLSSVDAWLGSSASQIRGIRQSGVGASSEVVSSWNEWIEGTPREAKATVVQPLVTAQWNQSSIYQLLTPYDESTQSNCYAGCGAIAMAQIMKYWNWPLRGRGSHSYYANGYGTLTADFDTIYDWGNMPDSLTTGSTDEEIDAVNMLIYHAGVSIDMDYSPWGSNSYVYYDNYSDGYSIERSLPTFFKYSSSVRSVIMSEYSPEEWREMLKEELRSGRPMVYRGGGVNGDGHIFILDGCDLEGNYHFNWGWGGWCDGYYAIGSLNPGNYTWNEGNCAVIGIKPKDNEESSVTCTAVANDLEWGTVNGGGTFDAYSGDVRLLANAAEGYRFSHWSDGSIANPRFYPACESRSDTAFFVPVEGDTMGFCSHRYRLSYGYSNPRSTWGATCLPKSVLNPNASIAAVELYATAVGTYTIKVCSGNVKKPGTPIHTQTFYVDSAERMVTLQFDSLVRYDVDKPMWLVMNTVDIRYAIPTCRYSGWTKSFLFSSDGISWNDCHEGLGWMSVILRGIFVNDDPVSIDDVDGRAEGLDVRVRGRMLTVTADGPVTLYDIGGRLLCTSSGTLEYYAPAAGVYIVRKGKTTRKIVLE